jgi:hypothetical protein
MSITFDTLYSNTNSHKSQVNLGNHIRFRMHTPVVHPRIEVAKAA